MKQIDSIDENANANVRVEAIANANSILLINRFDRSSWIARGDECMNYEAKCELQTLVVHLAVIDVARKAVK